LKIYRSEYDANYETYSFAYAVYCIPEDPGELSSIYDLGFLPYSGDTRLNAPAFYLARSIRVDLERFTDTSENRRIDRKAGELKLNIIEHTADDADINRVELLAFCEKYIGERFSRGTMSEERLRYIIDGPVINQILEFKSDQKPYGYVFAVIGEDSIHYWFAFFDTTYLHSHSLGKWMMWTTLHWAKERGLRYAYLGTCYGEKALYKVRNHQGIEFFDGNKWNTDLEVLKKLAHRDDSDGVRDRDLLKSEDENVRKSIFGEALKS
jgi:arginine-tRNA-protein transferase